MATVLVSVALVAASIWIAIRIRRVPGRTSRGPAPVPDGATPAQAPAATTTPEPENTAAPQTAAAESLDLVSAVAMPVLKRLGPVLGSLAFGLVLACSWAIAAGS
jgi:hypothetical protein